MQVILCDVSTSMADSVTPTKRRIDLMREVYRDLDGKRSLWTGEAKLFAFSHIVIPLPLAGPLPEPCGSTMLHMALAEAAPYHPHRVIVFSDGEPVRPDEALTAARALDCEICTFFCGSDTDQNARMFMRSLAWCSRDGLGRSASVDLRDPAKITHSLVQLLAAPER